MTNQTVICPDCRASREAGLAKLCATCKSTGRIQVERDSEQNTPSPSAGSSERISPHTNDTNGIHTDSPPGGPYNMDEVTLCKKCQTMKHVNAEGYCGRCWPTLPVTQVIQDTKGSRE